MSRRVGRRRKAQGRKRPSRAMTEHLEDARYAFIMRRVHREMPLSHIVEQCQGSALFTLDGNRRVMGEHTIKKLVQQIREKALKELAETEKHALMACYYKYIEAYRTASERDDTKQMIAATSGIAKLLGLNKLPRIEGDAFSPEEVREQMRTMHASIMGDSDEA